MTFRGFILLSAALCSGCATVFRSLPAEEFADKVSGQAGTVVCVDGAELPVHDMRVERDSLSFETEDRTARSAIPLRTVVSVIQTSHIRGAVDGTFLGLLSGGGLGLLGGGSAAALSGGGKDSGLMTGGGLLYGAILGGAAGLVYGTFTGHGYRYEIRQDSTYEPTLPRVAP
jgi:hypothetical protein